MTLSPIYTQPQPLTIVSIPAALANADRWLNWRVGKVDPKTGKFDKVPFNPATGKAWSDKDPANWRPLADCQFAGPLGFALGDGFAGIDLDHCRNKITGVITKDAQTIIDQAASYTEISPSGTGVKIFVLGALASAVISPIGESATIEIYSRDRFFAFTGQHLAGTPRTVRDAQAALDQLAQRYTPKPTVAAEKKPAQGVVIGAGKQATAQEVIADFKRLNSLSDLLQHYGCTHTRGQGDTLYFSGLPGDSHTHENTLKVRRGRVWAMSPNSRLWNGQRGHDAFDVYCLLEHGGNVHEALKALQPAQARQKAAPAPLPEPVGPTPDVLAQRAADAERKRLSRVDQAVSILGSVRARAAAEPLSKRNQMVLDRLLVIANTRSWCRPSVAALAEQTGYSERSVRYALDELERAKYFETEEHVSSNGVLYKGGKHTPIRTFLRWQNDPAFATVYITHDLTTLKESSSKGGRAEQPTPVVELAAVPMVEPEPIAIEGGASFDPAAAMPVPECYRGRTKRSSWSIDDCNRALRDLYIDQPAPAPVINDQADDAEQQPLVAEAPKPKRRRKTTARVLTAAEMLSRIFAMEGRAAKVQESNPRQASALRRQAKDLRAKYEVLQVADAPHEAVAPDCPPLEEKDAGSMPALHPNTAGPTLADLRALARVRIAALRSAGVASSA